MITPHHDAELVIPWRKSQYSNGGDNCVEIGPTHDSRIAIRHSHHPEQPTQTYPRNQWVAFLTDTKNDKFDFFTGGGENRPAAESPANSRARS